MGKCTFGNVANLNMTSFISDCLGSSDGKSQVLASGTTTLQRLRNQFENCTRIYGNLEINYIDQTALDEENADPYTALNFLNSIEEVHMIIILSYRNLIDHTITLSIR